MSDPWYTNPQEVIDFAHILVDADALEPGQRAVIYYFEKPWKWDVEHRVWCDSGRPDASSGPRWNVLLALFANIDNGRGPLAPM